MYNYESLNITGLKVWIPIMGVKRTTRLPRSGQECSTIDIQRQIYWERKNTFQFRHLKRTFVCNHTSLIRCIKIVFFGVSQRTNFRLLTITKKSVHFQLWLNDFIVFQVSLLLLAECCALPSCWRSTRKVSSSNDSAPEIECMASGRVSSCGLPWPIPWNPHMQESQFLSSPGRDWNTHDK